MAVQAMEQFGLMMTGIEPRLAPVRDRAQIENALASGRVAVWLPRDMMREHDGIPRCWGVTSDSLAAWLAHSLAARHLLLVKWYRRRREIGSCRSWCARESWTRHCLGFSGMRRTRRGGSIAHTTRRFGAIMEERYASGSRVVYAL